MATAVRNDAHPVRPRGGADAGGVSGDSPAVPAARRPGTGHRRVALAERRWLAEFVAGVRARHAEVVQDVIVYRSKACGDWNDDSDIDVLVIVADGGAARREALRKLASRLSATTDALPTILTRTDSEWRQLGDADPPLRGGTERDGFSVW